MTTAVCADLLLPTTRRNAAVYNTALVLGGSLLIALSARVVIPLPFTPVPITGHTLAVLLVAALLGSRRGVAAVLAYLAEGAAGLPVFSAGKAGLAYAMGATGGYLFGFIVAAYVVGLLAERGWDRRVGTTMLAMALGTAIYLTFGALWLGMVIGMKNPVLTGVVPFLAGDAVKIAIAATLLPAGWKLIGRRVTDEKTGH